jgi:hypothetical protein
MPTTGARFPDDQAIHAASSRAAASRSSQPMALRSGTFVSARRLHLVDIESLTLGSDRASNESGSDRDASMESGVHGVDEGCPVLQKHVEGTLLWRHLDPSFSAPLPPVFRFEAINDDGTRIFTHADSDSLNGGDRNRPSVKGDRSTTPIWRQELPLKGVLINIRLDFIVPLAVYRNSNVVEGHDSPNSSSLLTNEGYFSLQDESEP